MAPIKKLGDGRSTGLGWPPLDDDTQQPTERWRRQWGGHVRGGATGGNGGERTFTRRLGGSNAATKN